MIYDAEYRVVNSYMGHELQKVLRFSKKDLKFTFFGSLAE